MQQVTNLGKMNLHKSQPAEIRQIFDQTIPQHLHFPLFFVHLHWNTGFFRKQIYLYRIIEITTAKEDGDMYFN